MEFYGMDVFRGILLVIVIFIVPLIWLRKRLASRYQSIASVPVVPGANIIFGHALQMAKAEHAGMYDYLLMKKYGSAFGLIEFSKSVFVISDPDILKEILVRQFGSFTDRQNLPLRGLMKSSAFDEKGAEWKRLRILMTPFFSTSKLKNNFGNMHRASDTLMDILSDFCNKGKEFDVESVCSAFAIDVIFAAGFGINLDSQRNPNNPLYVKIRPLANVSFTSPFFLLALAFPFLSGVFETFGITMFPSGLLEFFDKAIKDMIKERMNEDQKHENVDFISAMVKAHLSAEVEKELAVHGDAANKKGMSDREITAQCLLLVLAGWSTSTMSLSFLMHQLAVNQCYQDRAVEELNAKIDSEDKLTYENISKLEFIDQCINESLRINPPIYRFDREAREDVTIGELHIPRGSIVTVPLWAMNHSSDFWPDPEKFDPDRFGPEVRDSISSYIHMPFGVGPRGCIGSRFAMLELKLSIARILREFRIVRSPNTQDPVEVQSGLFVVPKNGLPLSLERRRRANAC